MSKLIWQNDPLTEVIYDTICGMPIEKAIEILEQYERKRLIPIEWIKLFAEKIWWEDEKAVIENMLEQWEKQDE